MSDTYSFEMTCVDADPDDLEAMWPAAVEIDYPAFARGIGPETSEELEQTTPPLSREPYVSFHRTRFRGKRALVLTHSAINHIFTDH